MGDDGLIHSHLLDGRGGAQPLGWNGVHAWERGQGTLWVHLDRADPGAIDWLHRESGLDALVVEALLEPETRPRCTALPGGWLVVLRGVNLNPGADPEDMVAVRLWVEAARVLSVRRRRVIAAQDVQEALAAGVGPTGPGSLLAAIADRLTDRIGPVVAQLDEDLDAVEVDAMGGDPEGDRRRLGELRRQAILLRRHIAPQRDALLGLIATPAGVIDDASRARLREVADHVTRYVEDLDALRERAAVANDELSSRAAEALNRRMYVLSLVAAVFLPLGLITGLLGVNVGGIPGTDNEWGFWIVAALLVLTGGTTTALLRLRRLY